MNPDLKQRIESARQAYEQQLSRGNTEIHPHLQGLSPTDSEAMFRVLFSSQLAQIRQSGKPTKETDFVAQYPDYKNLVAEFFANDTQVENADTHVDAASTLVGSDSVGRQFGRYQIVRSLGEGAMGSVYLAHDSELKRPVALKVPKLFGLKSEEIKSRFYREARSAGKLHHRNICPVYDIGEVDGQLYITMAFIEGKTLYDMLAQIGKLSGVQAARLTAKLAKALAVAHQQGVIHRDLKPSNILIDSSHEPVVMDFGLARIAQGADATELTGQGDTLGTPAFMSPEQAAGKTDLIGPATDIYSLGVVLFQLITGKLPYRGDVMSVMYKVIHEAPPAPTSLVDDLPPELEAICLKMMAKDISQRYGSMEEVAEALEAFLAVQTGGMPVITTTNQSAVKASAAAKSSNQSLPMPMMLGIGGAVAALLLVVGIAGWSFVGALFGGSNTNTADGQTESQTFGQNSASPNDKSDSSKRPLPALAVFPFDGVRAKELQHNWAKYLGVAAKKENSVGMNLVLIPPGAFEIGSSDDEVDEALAEAEALSLSDNYLEYIESEAPLRDETISQPFYLSSTEVTVGQFKQFVKETGYTTTAESSGLGGFGYISRQQVDGVDWRNPELEQTDDHPVVEITLADAEQFCVWLSKKEGVKYSLPTEAQWEFACRAGSYSLWSCGDDPEVLKEHAWLESNSGYNTHPVGTKLANAYGLYDMHGNVREWCARIPTAPATGMLRGGAFLKPALLLRSAQRIAFKSVTPYPYHGFRVMAAIPEAKDLKLPNTASDSTSADEEK